MASEDREGWPGLALLALAILVLAGCDTLGETPGAAPATTASPPTAARAARSGPPLTTQGKGKVNCAQRSVVAFSHAMFPAEPDYRTWPELFGSASAAEFEAAAAEAAAALRRHG